MFHDILNAQRVRRKSISNNKITRKLFINSNNQFRILV